MYLLRSFVRLMLAETRVRRHRLLVNGLDLGLRTCGVLGEYVLFGLSS